VAKEKESSSARKARGYENDVKINKTQKRCWEIRGFSLRSNPTVCPNPNLPRTTLFTFLLYTNNCIRHANISYRNTRKQTPFISLHHFISYHIISYI